MLDPLLIGFISNSIPGRCARVHAQDLFIEPGLPPRRDHRRSGSAVSGFLITDPIDARFAFFLHVTLLIRIISESFIVYSGRIED